MAVNKIVLVLEDLESVRETIGDMLEIKGWVPVLAATSEEAYVKAEEYSPFCACIDLILDDGTKGEDTAQNLIYKHPHIITIAVTGMIANFEIGYLREMGFTDVVLKPFLPDALWTVLDHAYAKSKRWHNLMEG